jgi:hypothetical protein
MKNGRNGGIDFLWKVLEMPAVNRVTTKRTSLRSQHAAKKWREPNDWVRADIRVSRLALHLDLAVGKRRSQFVSYEIHLSPELCPLLA